jgi:hypothetical protein
MLAANEANDAHATRIVIIATAYVITLVRTGIKRS